MPRYLAVVLSAVVLALLVLSCSGGGGPPATPSPGPGETTTTEPAESPTLKPTPTSDGEATPTAGATATATTAPTPAAIGTPAVAPADLSRFQGQTIDEDECLFDPRTAVVTCPGRGTFAIDPPLVAQDISCSVLIVQNEPVAIRCSSQEPLQTVYYDIQ